MDNAHSVQENEHYTTTAVYIMLKLIQSGIVIVVMAVYP